MDALWPLELVRYAADKMIMPGMDRGFGKSVGERFPDVFNIDVPSIFYSRLEILGLPTGDSLRARLCLMHICTFCATLSCRCVSHTRMHCCSLIFMSSPTDVGMTLEDVVSTFKSHGVVLEEKNVTRMSEFRRDADIRTSTKLVFGTPEQAREVRCMGGGASRCRPFFRVVFTFAVPLNGVLIVGIYQARIYNHGHCT